MVHGFFAIDLDDDFTLARVNVCSGVPEVNVLIRDLSDVETLSRNK